jgi:hypothetical protein
MPACAAAASVHKEKLLIKKKSVPQIIKSESPALFKTHGRARAAVARVCFLMFSTRLSLFIKHIKRDAQMDYHFISLFPANDAAGQFNPP